LPESNGSKAAKAADAATALLGPAAAPRSTGGATAEGPAPPPRSPSTRCVARLHARRLREWQERQMRQINTHGRS
jgi:hypothetical protein